MTEEHCGHTATYWFYVLSIPTWMFYILQLALALLKNSQTKNADNPKQPKNEQSKETQPPNEGQPTWRMLTQSRYIVQLLNVIEIIWMLMQQHWYKQPLPNEINLWYALYFTLLWQALLLGYLELSRFDSKNLVFVVIPLCSAWIWLMHATNFALSPPFKLRFTSAFGGCLILTHGLRIVFMLIAIRKFTSGYPGELLQELMKRPREVREILAASVHGIHTFNVTEPEKDQTINEKESRDEISIMSPESLKTLFDLIYPRESVWLQIYLLLSIVLSTASRWVIFQQSIYLSAVFQEALGERRDQSLIIRKGVIYGTLFVVGKLMAFAEQHFSQSVQNHGSAKLAFLYHRRIMELSPDVVDQCTTSPYEPCFQASITWNVLEELHLKVMLLPGSIWISVQALILLHNPYLMLILLAETMHYMWLSLRADSEREEVRSQIHTDMSVYSKTFRESMANWPVVMAHNQSDREHAEVRKAHAQYKLASNRFKHIISYRQNVKVGLLSMTHFCAFVFGISTVRFNKDYLLMVFTNWGQMGAPVRTLDHVVKTWVSDKDGVVDLLRLCKMEPEVRNQPDAKELVFKGQGPPTISFLNVGLASKNAKNPSNPNPGSKDILKNVSFNVKPGNVLAVIGASGCGKTTLATLLLRLRDPDTGSIEIDGQPIHKVTRESLRYGISFVHQKPMLFKNRSFVENARYANPGATNERIQEAYKAVDLHGFISTLDKGYDTIISDARLSGGQLQRIPIVRELLKETSRILVLDEATSSVDVKTERRIQEAIGAFAADRTIIVIAHRLSTVKHADLTIVMNDGEIVQVGHHADLLSEEGPYRDLWALDSMNEESGAFAKSQESHESALK